MLICIILTIVNTSCSDSNDDMGVETACKPCEPCDPCIQAVDYEIRSDYAFDNYTYPVKVVFPPEFSSNKNLPVIYVLDGTLNLAKVRNNLGSNKKVIVVGIGDFAYKQEWARRWIDLKPTGSICYGGKGKHLDFYDFITKQVIPFVEEENGIVPSSRTLIGHSSAGLFALVSLFMENSEDVMFDYFVASDPELGCDLNFFTELLDNNDFSEGTQNFKLYLALSNSGSIDAVRQFSEALQIKEYSWLNYRYEEFLNQDHMSIVDPSFKSGLNFIFNTID